MLALAHGTNDAQKTMGVITLALIANGNLSATDFEIPTWVIVASATAIALGTYTGGWRIIRTMGTRIIKMDSAQGFSAQGAGAAAILASSHFGFPLSTTQVIAGGVMGAGAGKRLSAVRWGVAGNLVVAWVLTLPAAAAIGAASYGFTSIFGTGRPGPLLVSMIAIVLGLGALRSADPPRAAGADRMSAVLSACSRQDRRRRGPARRDGRLAGRRRDGHARRLDRDLRLRDLRRGEARGRAVAAFGGGASAPSALLVFAGRDRHRPDRDDQRDEPAPPRPHRSRLGHESRSATSRSSRSWRWRDRPSRRAATSPTASSRRSRCLPRRDRRARGPLLEGVEPHRDAMTDRQRGLLYGASARSPS